MQFSYLCLVKPMYIPTCSAQWKKCPGDILETTRARMHPEVGQGFLEISLLKTGFHLSFWKISNLWLLCGLAALAGWRESCVWGRCGGGLSLPAALSFRFGEDMWGYVLGACRVLRRLWLLNWIWGSEVSQADAGTKGPFIGMGHLPPSFVAVWLAAFTSSVINSSDMTAGSRSQFLQGSFRGWVARARSTGRREIGPSPTHKAEASPLASASTKHTDLVLCSCNKKHAVNWRLRRNMKKKLFRHIETSLVHKQAT